MARLKRLLSPNFWKVPKKASKWTVSPSPGPHKKMESIPLQIIIHNVLKMTEKSSESRQLVKRREFLVDGKVRTDSGYPIGMMDVVSVPLISKNYRLVPSSKGLTVIEIPDKESGQKLCKITGKKILRGKKVQINLHDGKNLLVGKDIFNTGDSVMLEIPGLKILSHIKLEKGSLALITKGKNSGKFAKVKEVIITKSREPNKVICEIDGKDYAIIKDFIFVVGKDKPQITLT